MGWGWHHDSAFSRVQELCDGDQLNLCWRRELKVTFRSSLVAQWVGDPVLSLQRLRSCCGTGSIPYPGTSTCPRHIRKKKKSYRWMEGHCPAVVPARAGSGWENWLPASQDFLHSWHIVHMPFCFPLVPWAISFCFLELMDVFIILIVVTVSLLLWIWLIFLAESKSMYVFLFLWPRPGHAEVPGPEIEPLPQQCPKPQQWQCRVLNPLSHQETQRFFSY